MSAPPSAPWEVPAERDGAADPDQEENKVAVHRFRRPRKMIHAFTDIPRWQQSNAWHDIVGFVLLLNERVKGKPNDAQRTVSENVRKTVEFVTNMKKWVEEIPPIQQPMRFGNKAFRTWHAKVMQEGPDFMRSVLPPQAVEANALEELGQYLAEAFGSLQRIDYGTGHELNFVVWLCCLHKLGAFTAEDQTALVLDVFVAYLDLMRTLQRTYWLEPAGSKGVWGLDDFQFLSFIWGASQLIGQNELVPHDITRGEVVSQQADKYMYFACIKFITTMKRGPFAEHSPLLNDISGVPKWEKVNSGLIKMYHDEVLNQFPVVQHFYFGTILTFDAYRAPSAHTDHSAQAHSHALAASAPHRAQQRTDSRLVAHQSAGPSPATHTPSPSVRAAAPAELPKRT